MLLTFCCDISGCQIFVQQYEYLSIGCYYLGVVLIVRSLNEQGITEFPPNRFKQQGGG